MNSPSVNDLISQARGGDSDALGTLLEGYRPFLELLARRQLDPRVHARVGLSDVVQQTFLEAQRDFAQFRGQVEGEIIAWLRQVLDHNVAEAVRRHVVVQKRTTNKERSLDAPGKGGRALGNLLPSDQSTPSQRAMRDEAAVQLALAMDTLPEDQKEAIRLRHLEGWSLAQIAEHFKRSDVAVAGLVKRGLRGLRKQLANEA